MTNVISFSGKKEANEEGKLINKDALEKMQEITEKLQSGEVTSVGLVVCFENGNVMTYISPSDTDYHRQLSGAVMLQHQLYNVGNG